MTEDRSPPQDPRRQFAVYPGNDTAQSCVRDLLDLGEEIRDERAKFEAEEKAAFEANEDYKQYVALAEKMKTLQASAQEAADKRWNEQFQGRYDERARETLTGLRIALGTTEPIQDNRLYVIDASAFAQTGVAVIVPNPQIQPDEAIQLINELKKT